MTCTLAADAHTLRHADGTTERAAELHIVLSSAQHAALLSELRASSPGPDESGLETVLHALLRVLAADEEAGQ